MEIVNIEKETFDSMVSELKTLSDEVNFLYEACGDRGMGQWLDNQDVCIILNISKRSLQSYRDNGKLPYSRIGHKTYYKAQDVETLLNQTVKLNTQKES